MILARFALAASRAKTTPQRLNPIDTHIRATRRRFTFIAARAIPTRDHFAQRNRQRQVIAHDMNVIEQEHLPTSMQQLVRTRLVYVFRPQPAHHATARSIDARRSDAAVARQRVRLAPPTLAASRPLHACTAMKRPCFAGKGRAAAPARASGEVRRETPPPALAASRPLHARTAKTRRARWQRSRRGSRPRLWVTSSRAPPPPAPASGGVRRESHPPTHAASRPLRARTALTRRARGQRSRRGSRPRECDRASQ